MAIERFKRLEDTLMPDGRSVDFDMRDPATGTTRPYTLADLHAGLAALSLNSSVPEVVQNHFLTARHLLLYAWFVYRFVPVANMQAYGSLEFALRERLGQSRAVHPPALKDLLIEAAHTGLLRDQGFRDWPGHRNHSLEIPGRPAAWVEDRLVAHLPHFRNELAHGSAELWPDGGRALRIAADGINQLYP